MKKEEILKDIIQINNQLNDLNKKYKEWLHDDYQMKTMLHIARETLSVCLLRIQERIKNKKE